MLEVTNLFRKISDKCDLVVQVPSLFMDNEDDATNGLNSDLTKAYYDMNKIKKNFMAEHVDIDAAKAVVKKLISTE
jgi:hypothetical protein